ncbi:PREDICTED: neurogenic locus Notch protein-like isoform X1 [Acropora digitifera]|uniref:neurogenic locus Notch protein-like isoform X1 n=2 Tax=Acropora digitifera TaxID=70779 RepID=UPI00077A6E4B|nr:PREDICTED: neurogenic locus Notch protein-like isoform X1 [Acropora digitifera]
MGSLSVFVLYVLHSSSCLANIDRIITFKEPIPERVMEDHVLSSSRVQTEGSCRVNCYMEPNCVSINMRRLAGGAMICELNDVTTSDYFVLTTKSSHSYMEIENPCSSNPCMGKTRCQAGFTSKGFRCQPTPIDINESNQNSCKNGGTWIVKDGKHQCHCPRNFTGSSCEIHTNECNHSLCENGGTCKLKDGKHNCHCPRNFTGSSCEIHAQEIGCFTDKFYDRALLFLESYRGRIPWNNLWKVVRDCSKAAKKLKYYYFAIQGYGDCWAGLANQTYDKHGHSDNCHSRPGLGGQLTNFVYKFTDV